MSKQQLLNTLNTEGGTSSPSIHVGRSSSRAERRDNFVQNAARRVDLKRDPARRRFHCNILHLWASFFISWARICCRLFRWSSTFFCKAIAKGSSRRCRASWMCLFNSGPPLVVRSSSSIGPVGLSSSSPTNSIGRASTVETSTTANSCTHRD